MIKAVVLFSLVLAVVVVGLIWILPAPDAAFKAHEKELDDAYDKQHSGNH